MLCDVGRASTLDRYRGPRCQRLSTSAVSRREATDTWTIVKVTPHAAQVGQISLAQGWIKAFLLLPAWKMATAVVLSENDVTLSGKTWEVGPRGVKLATAARAAY